MQKTIENGDISSFDSSKSVLSPTHVRLLAEHFLMTRAGVPEGGRSYGSLVNYAMHVEPINSSSTIEFLSYAYLTPGIYKMLVHGRVNNDAGYWDIYIDDQFTVTWDASDSGSGYPNGEVMTMILSESFSIGTGGNKKIQLKCRARAGYTGILWKSLTFMRYI